MLALKLLQLTEVVVRGKCSHSDEYAQPLCLILFERGVEVTREEMSSTGE